MSMQAPPSPSGLTGSAHGRPSGSSGLSGAQISQLVNNYKLTPTTLFAELNDWWIPAYWLQYLGAEIASAISRGGCGLLISAPPRHGKSKLITVATPLWTLENFPNKNVIVATYGEDLSTDFTRETKDLIKANPDRLSIRIRRDVDRAQNFVTPQGGGLKAVGLRGTITGRGADVLIIDDYIKEPKEALSFNYLESLKTWYQTVSRTRLEPNAVVIIVATRWVTNDLHGYIERLERDRPKGRKHFYKIIKLQAISGTFDRKAKVWVEGKEPDLLGRPPGTPLFAARYGLEGLEDIRYELGDRWFEAMFQQNPTSENSAVTDWNNIKFMNRKDYEQTVLMRRAENPARYKHRRGWDLASTKNAGDYTVGGLAMWDKLDDIFYIENIRRGQWAAAKVEEIFQYYAAPEGGDDNDVEYIIEQEPGSSGKYTVNHFAGLAPNRRVRFVNSATEGSKLLKAQPFLAACGRGQVVLVVDDVTDLQLTPWVREFQDEFEVFPEGGHDDIMDSISTAYNDATGRKAMAGAFGRGTRSKEAQERFKQGEPLSENLPVRSKVTFGRQSRATLGKGNQKYVRGSDNKLGTVRIYR